MKMDNGPSLMKRKSLKKINIVRAKFTDITNDYAFETKPIGTGGFGSVYRGKHRETGQIRAIKHIQLKENLATVDSSSKLLFIKSTKNYNFYFLQISLI